MIAELAITSACLSANIRREDTRGRNFPIVTVRPDFSQIATSIIFHNGSLLSTSVTDRSMQGASTVLTTDLSMLDIVQQEPVTLEIPASFHELARIAAMESGIDYDQLLQDVRHVPFFGRIEGIDTPINSKQQLDFLDFEYDIW